MSILSNMRDVVANIALGKALEGVRDRQLAAVRSGTALAPAQLLDLEREAVARVAKTYYNPTRSAGLGLEEVKVDHKTQYAERGTVCTDIALQETHRILCSLPIVGDPQFDVGG
jgi:hypothetical protein